MKKTDNRGFIIPAILGFMAFFVLMMVSLSILFSTNIFIVRNNVNRQRALDIAEAGVNYYMWHLSHNTADVTDGHTPGTPDPTLGYGPYVHDYVDGNAVKQGTYTLWLQPQGTGSTIIKIRSIGKVKNSTATRTIDAQIGVPSFASYGVISDEALWFGNTETASGPIHSNKGVRMDGANTADVTSPNATYVPSSSLGGNGFTSRPGVWCDTGVTSPVNCNTRNKSNWRYPVPSIDFNQVNGSLCTIKKIAFSSDAATTGLANAANACTQTPTTRTAAYLPQRSSSGTYSDTVGYYIELNSDHTYNLSSVSNEKDTNTSVSTALTKSSIANNIPVPASGVIFAEDNVWVRTSSASGFKGKLTIAAARLATSANANITVADDILYNAKDGSNTIGLIAEDSVRIAPYAPPRTSSFTFEVDAAIIAVTGSVQYPYKYNYQPSRCTMGWVGASQKFLFYGSVASRSSWTWTWLSGSCGDNVNSGGGNYISGILHNTTQYDYSLLYGPPPSFPVTNGYNILSWRESVAP